MRANAPKGQKRFPISQAIGGNASGQYSRGCIVGFPHRAQRRRMRTYFLLLAFAATAAQAGPVASGDFESGINITSAWTAKDTVPGNASSPPTPTLTPVAGARTGGLGAQFVRVGGRDQVQDGPQQGSFNSNALRAALFANGNGRIYTTRIWVRLDASAQEASIRCLLRWRDNSVTQTPLLLAERILTAADGWVEMTGTAKLQWATSLSAATVEFECEQLHRGTTYPPPSTWFPGFDLDDFAMELDDDGDGLWNSEESANHSQTALPFSDDSDSDDDGLPDDWEKRFPLALNPRNPSDGAADSDGDGFTNFQEYHASTDPTDASSFPGKPSDSSATFLTRALLRALALAPSRGHTWSGQHIRDNVTDFDAYWTPLGAAQNGGRLPAIMSLTIEGINVPLQITASTDLAIAHTLAGGVPLLKWAMPNPWRSHLMNNQNINGKEGDQVAVDIAGLLDPAYPTALNATPLTPPPGASASNQIARSIMDGWIDSVAAEIKRYSAATGGAPLLFRPLSEMNGPWFWWGHRTLAEYQGLWDHIRDRLTLPAPLGHDIHNLIWVYESASSEHLYDGPVGISSASDYYYPGDDRVDCFGHNLYDDDWVLTWDANMVYRQHPKIYCVPQAGAGAKGVAARAHTFSNDIYLARIPAAYSRLSFVIPWNDFDSQDDDDNNPVTPDSDDDGVAGTDTPSHKYLSIVSSGALDGSAARFMADARIITRDELLWRPPTAPAASALSSTQLSLAWNAATGAAAYRVEESANGGNGWSLVATPAAGPQSVGGLAASSTRWLRVRSLFPDGGDSLPTDAASATTWSLFQQWKNDWLGTIAAPDLGDDDRDGVVNLLEYGLGTPPLVASPPPSQSLVTISGASYLALTFRRRVGSSGMSYIVEATSDLLNSPWLPQPVQFGVPVDNGDGTETVTFRDIFPTGSVPSRFLRLRLTLP